MATSRVHLAVITAAVTGMLVAMAIWTQSRLGSALLPHAFCITGSQPLLARTSARAQQTSAVLDAFFESAPVGLAIIGQDEKLLRTNGAFTALNALASTGGPAATLRDLAPAVGAELARLVRDGHAVRRL